MFPASDYPLDYLADLPVFTSSALREDKAFHVPGTPWGTREHLIVGIRPLTDAQLAGLEAAYAVRVAYAEAGIMSWLGLPCGTPPTRESVNFLNRLRAYAPTSTGLTTVMPPPSEPYAVSHIVQTDTTPWRFDRATDSKAVMQVVNKPVVRRGVPIETSRFARIADNEIIEHARRIMERDARAEGFHIISDLTIAERHVLDPTTSRWHPAHYPIPNPVRDKHVVVANTYDL